MIIKYVVRTGYGEYNRGVYDDIKEADFAACCEIIESDSIRYKRYSNDMEAFAAHFEEEHAYLQLNEKRLVYQQFERDSVCIDEVGFDENGDLIMIYGQELNEYLEDNFGEELAEKERAKLIEYFAGN